jgi:predicted DNA-binding ribbon-helix-helix protein
MKKYSVIQFDGSSQSVEHEKLSYEEAKRLAEKESLSYSDSVVAVVDDDTDVARDAYNHGKLLSSGMIRSIVYGLGRVM